MRTIFGAIGPSIAQQKTIDPFQNIELYNLFTSKCTFAHNQPQANAVIKIHKNSFQYLYAMACSFG